jgi:hypothetical protein
MGVGMKSNSPLMGDDLKCTFPLPIFVYKGENKKNVPGEKMENIKTLNHNLATIGNGMLFIWWGMVIMIDPLTIGMGAIGTGVIMLGVNAARLLYGIPTKGSTTVVGIIALVWGILDTALRLTFESSFAIMLVVIGAVTIASLLIRTKTE